ncbi:hypothetical protein M422DRAFT_241461 [Sphaerobolus stellatus SS14]|nr:hypothetical protein M422DRAFT_241461 [Sphaerobolus stellatus SS14]
MPLLNITERDAPSTVPPISADSFQDRKQKKGWLTYAPLSAAVFLILMPHPSFELMLSSHYLKTHYHPMRFTIHLLSVYVLTLLTLVSLTICAVRDPGSVTPRQKTSRNQIRGRDAESEHALLRNENMDDEDEAELLALAEIEELAQKGRWCRKCERRRPERAHHCSACGRCILKMDHHCPWIGNNCVGHRTYPAFVHFVSMCTLLPLYITCVAVAVIVSLVQDPFTADPDVSPLHALFLAIAGGVFTIVMGSFVIYHFYLIIINQTTLEHMSPYHLLRHLPPPPSHPKPANFPPPPSASSPHHDSLESLVRPPTPPVVGFDSPVDSYALYSYPPTQHTTAEPLSRYRPPEEHELTHSQRRLIRHYHGRIRMYDLGWSRNWGEVFGGGGKGSRPKWKWWLRVLLHGGWPRGDGWDFEKSKGIDRKLERLSKELDEVGRKERQERALRA